MSKEITPTPWFIDTEDVLCITNGKTRKAIAVIHGTRPSNYADKQEKAYCLERVANAKHIVKCVNENEALHARIKELETIEEGLAGVIKSQTDTNLTLIKRLKKLEAK